MNELVLEALDKLRKVKYINVAVNKDYFIRNTVMIEKTEYEENGVRHRKYRLITTDIVLEIDEIENNVTYHVYSVKSLR